MRKRKLFTGNIPIGGSSIKSRRVARKVTSKFHELNNLLVQKTLEMENDNNSNNANSNEIQKLKRSIEELGGRNKYQEASIISTQHHQVLTLLFMTV
jgi:hypothetical protein